ncbi:cation:proton antiporter [Amphibacillus sediminis]|uniref:cation:proton antiporter n=1 Tax=Amphibacillus sediminis TaxID=360185 RepID=UPI00082C97DC|nr:cation:proton antiporter [Amphibacillus sediminis]
MLVSLGLLIVLGYAAGKLARMIRLPELVGMLIAGIILGPALFNWLDADMLHISGDLRALALIIILIRAGLGITPDHIKQIGKRALLFASIPCLFEGITVLVAARFIFGLEWAEAGMLGFILAAVSPAVVVPSMVELKQLDYGKDKHVPTLVLAGASLDDVFAITLFTLFLGLGTASQTNLWLEIGKIPLAIGGGILTGLIVAIVVLFLFKKFQFNNHGIDQLLLLLGLLILYYHVSDWLGIAGLIGIMTVGLMLFKNQPTEAERLSHRLTELWVFAQILLFTLVGAEVNLSVALQAGLLGAVIIVIGLLGRGIGVFVATLGSSLNWKERLFCLIAYTPKATVQAAIGSLPLMAGVEAGQLILAVAVLAIVITAPLGAIGIKWSAPKLLNKG